MSTSATAGCARSTRARSSSAGRSSSTASSAAFTPRAPPRGTSARASRTVVPSPGADSTSSPYSGAEGRLQPRVDVRRARSRAPRRPARAPPPRRVIPAPPSLTRQLDVGVEVGAEDLDRHGPAADSTPWRTAFSTSGCIDSTGTTAVSTSGATLTRTSQPVAEARLLEPQVLLDVVQLVGQRHVGAVAAERVAGELGELGQQLARLLGLVWIEFGHRGQRVVDEVRRDLGAQRAQLGLREPLLLRGQRRQLDLRATPAPATSLTTRVSSGRSRRSGP